MGNNQKKEIQVSNKRPPMKKVGNRRAQDHIMMRRMSAINAQGVTSIAQGNGFQNYQISEGLKNVEVTLAKLIKKARLDVDLQSDKVDSNGK